MLDMERDVNEIVEKNNEYLEVFAQYLEENGLKDKTISRHLWNVSFYLNDFLAYYNNLTMEEGTQFENLDDFFGDFFVRKCMWSTPETVKQNIAGLNKFYKCMSINGYIPLEIYENYTTAIKESKEFWIDFCEDYNEPSMNMFFI